jgi:hypothetical protein
MVRVWLWQSFEAPVPMLTTLFRTRGTALVWLAGTVNEVLTSEIAGVVQPVTVPVPSVIVIVTGNGFGFVAATLSVPPVLVPFAVSPG